MRLGYTM